MGVNSDPSLKFLRPVYPLVTVVMPTYNRAEFLTDSIGSVLGQSLTDFELIVVDDGSQDNSEEVIRGLGDDRILYAYQKNRGEYSAVNLGLRMARGQLVTWIHSDDRWPVDSLERRVKALQQSDQVDLVHGDIERIDSSGTVTEHIPAQSGDAHAIFLATKQGSRNHAYPIHLSSFLFRRSLLDAAGFFDETLPWKGDIDWMLRMLRVATIAKAPGVLYQYRTHAKARRVTDPASGVDTAAFSKFIHERYVWPTEQQTKAA